MTVPNPSTKYLLQSNVVDSVGSHDGTNSGVTFANDTTLNRDVAIFSNSHFEAPSQLATEITSMYSVSMWVYLDSVGSDYMILFTDHRAGQAYASLDARVLASGQLEIRHRQANVNASRIATSTASLQAGQWTHIAFAWSNVIGMAIYINGSLDSSKSMGYIPYNSTQPMKFGADQTGGGYSNRFQGKMADIRWWSANVLDGVQIGILYSDGAEGTDGSSGNQTDLTTDLISHYRLDGDANDSHGTRNGAVNLTGNAQFVEDSGKTFLSLSGDGAANIGSFPFTTEDFTVSFWMRTTGTPSQSWLPIISSLNADKSGWSFGHWLSRPHKFTFQSGTGTAWSNSHTYKLEISQNAWQHVTLVRTGTQVKAYLNGNFAGYNAPCAATIAYNTGDSTVHIGQSLIQPGGHYNGDVDDIRIWERALAAAEVASLYGEGRPDTQQSGSGNQQSGSGSAGKNYSAVIGVPTSSASYDLPTANEPSGWVVTLDNGESYIASTGEESSWSGPIAIPEYSFGSQKVGDSGIIQAGGFYIAKKPKGVSTGYGKPIAYANALDVNGDAQLPSSWTTVMGSDSADFSVATVYADPHVDRVIMIAEKSDPNTSGWQNRMFISNRAKESTDTLSFTRLNSGVASGNITAGDIKILSGSSNRSGTHVFTALKREDDATPDAKSVLFIENMFNASESYETAPYRGELGGDGYLEVGTSSLWDGSDDFIMHTWFKVEDVPPNPMFVFGCLGDQSGFSLNLSKTDPNTQVLDNDIGILLEFPSSGGSIFKHWDPEDQGSVEIKPGKWHHIALSFNHNGGSSSSTHKFTVHLDGQKVGSFDQDVTINSSLTIGNGKTENGVVVAQTTDDFQFRGSIAGFSVGTHSIINRFNEDLDGNGVYSDDEIVNLFNAGVSTFGLECSGGINGDGVGAAHTDNGILKLGMNFKPQTQDNFTCSEAAVPSNVRNLGRPLNILGQSGASGIWLIPCDNGYLSSTQLSNGFTGVKLRLEKQDGQKFGVNIKQFVLGWSANDTEWGNPIVDNDLPKTILGVGVLRDFSELTFTADISLDWSANDTEFNGLTAGDGIVIRSIDGGTTWDAIAANEEAMTNIATTVPIWTSGGTSSLVGYSGIWVIGGSAGVMGISTDNGSSFSNIDFVETNASGNDNNITGIHFGGASLVNAYGAGTSRWHTVKKQMSVPVGASSNLDVIMSDLAFSPFN